MAKTKFEIEVDYDETVTDPESLSNAFDHLLDTAMSTPNILEECGDVRTYGFFVVEPKPA